MMNEPTPRVSLTKSLHVIPDPEHNDPTTSSPSDTFLSQSLWRPAGARGVFGGQVIAQALLAACATIPPPLGLHSQHCYFLLAADADIPITYTVERLRDGKSYATRFVLASQKGKVVFVLLASFALPPINLAPLRDGGDIPFGFIPSQNKEVPPLSYSVRTVVEPNPSAPLPDVLPDVVPEAKASNWMFFSQQPEKVSSPDPGFAERYQVALPDGIVPYKDCVMEEVRWQRFLDEKGDELKGRSKTAVEEYIVVSPNRREGEKDEVEILVSQERKESPISIAVAKPRQSTEDGRHHRIMWMRARLAPGERPDVETVKVSLGHTLGTGVALIKLVLKAMIAYMTDFQFVGIAARSLGLTRNSTPRLGMLASLDHTTHFYPLPPDFDPATPLLHVMESALADVASGRGVVRGLLYTQEGLLVAATLQEGVVRADFGGEKADRGLVEGGGMGITDDAREKMKAKL